MDFDTVAMLAAAGTIVLLLLALVALAMAELGGVLLGAGTLGFMFHMAYRSDRKQRRN
jgi:hypothetical protein